jgi:oligoendopeptidase F
MIPPLKQLDAQYRKEAHRAYARAIKAARKARVALVAEVGEEKTRQIEAQQRREYMATLEPELIRAGIDPNVYERSLFGE